MGTPRKWKIIMFARDTGVSNLNALNMLLGRYQSQRRLEETVRVQTTIDRLQAKLKDYGHEFQQHM
jgi:hypothetical protein